MDLLVYSCSLLFHPYQVYVWLSMCLIPCAPRKRNQNLFRIICAYSFSTKDFKVSPVFPRHFHSFFLPWVAWAKSLTNDLLGLAWLPSPFTRAWDRHEAERACSTSWLGCSSLLVDRICLQLFQTKTRNVAKLLAYCNLPVT